MSQATHLRIVAGLHIACAILGVLAVLAFWMFAAVQFAFIDKSVDLNNPLSNIGFLIALPFLLFAAGEAVAAVAMLKGSRTGRGFVLAYSFLHLINIPIGTAVGVYSLWVLLRAEADTAPALPPVAPT